VTGKRKAFVLMPFRQPFDTYYPTVFQPALEACGFSVHRADDIYTPRPVMLDIQESILTSDLILCEMTGRSPNVFYELGLAHAVGKPAILVSTDEEDIPFDLQHVRVIHYKTEAPGWEDKLRQEIQKAALAATTPGNLWPPPLLSGADSKREPGRNSTQTIREAQGREPREVARPVNLGFDGTVEQGFPHGWFNSAGQVTNVSLEYAVRVVDREDGVPGRCLMMFKSAAVEGEFGSVMQRFPASYLSNRAIRLEGELQTHDVRGWAGFWLRADGEGRPDLFFDNMSGHRVKGTSDWSRHVLEANLPDNVAWLNLGVVFSGSGTVWADNLRLSYWSPDRTWLDV
jgi:hypothetical protein